MLPRTLDQISALISKVLSEELEEMKIAGYCEIDYLNADNSPQTMSVAVLNELKISCPRLKTLVFRKCRFDFEPAAYENLPETLQTLKFYGCRYINFCNFLLFFVISDLSSSN